MAFIIAKELGISSFDERNLKCCCPFHDEDTPSFIWNKKALSFHCFGACGQSYDIIDVFMKKGSTYIEAVQQLFDLADVKYAFGEHKAKTNHQYRYPHEVPLTDKEQVYAYLESRKISKKTADYLDIREEDGNCVFNYYDTNDTLTMVKYRPARKIRKGENKNWCQKDADTYPLLYNMNRVNIDQPLLITSGELDCAAAIEAGWQNAVSIPLGDQNTQWVDKNFDWLEQFKEIIICPDNDESGMKYCRDIIPRLGSWRCKTAIVPEGCKDINEVLFRHGATAVLDMIVHAKDSPIPSIADLSDVEDLDLDKIDGITTGIAPLDKELMRLFFGTLLVISGTPGSGKTSFIYQIVSKALEQNRNCWLFSKELPEAMTKNWLNYILAGGHNIEQFQTDTGAVYYKVKPQAKGKINDYYRGKWFVYKDSYSNKLDDLIASMTDAVRRHNVKLVLLDNLMTIDLGGADNDQLQRQTECINKLIQFSVKYNVATILVAHPRKLANTSDVGIYDISGSSNIVNLAHRTLGLRRVTAQEKEGIPKFNGDGWQTPPCKHDVLLTVVKDRMRGRQNFVCGMYYDIKSRRFFTSPEEFEFQYKWDDTVYKEHLQYPINDELEGCFV